MNLALLTGKRAPGVYVADKRIRITPAAALAKGGEADIYRLDADTVLKLFKQPGHPDLVGQLEQQKAARERIAEHQGKLPQFPAGLPDRVIQPLELATDETDSIVGYTMQFVPDAEVLMRYGDRGFRETGITKDFVLDAFRDIHSTVRAVHAAGIVIGDFNDLNVLVAPNGFCYLIDADSFQFGRFCCRLFTEKFVDPLLCDTRETRPVAVRPHNASSDWYAYTIMLMQCMVYAGPYSGIYKPLAGAPRIPSSQRPLKRITVFNPDVKYPKPALPISSLPTDAVQYFQDVFEHDYRGEFPLELLDVLQSGRSISRHAQVVVSAAPAAITGQVTATRIFGTPGHILATTCLAGRPQWVCHQDGAYVREDGRILLRAAVNSTVTFAISGKSTVACLRGPGGMQATAMLFGANESSTWTIDACAGIPAIAANSHGVYFVSGGILQHRASGAIAPRVIGRVLSNQVRIWVGEQFGFGFYRAGDLDVKFVFGAEKGTLNDSLSGFSIRGQLIDADCCFAADRCWLMVSVQEAGRRINRAWLLDRNGQCIAAADAEAGDGTWLGTIHGKCPLGHALLCATDEGIVRVEAASSQLIPAKSFPGTEEFVTTESRLLATTGGLLVVSAQEIIHLSIA